MSEKMIVITGSDAKDYLMDLIKLIREEEAAKHKVPDEPLCTLEQIRVKLKWGRDKLLDFRKEHLIAPAEMRGNVKMYKLSQFLNVQEAGYTKAI